MSALSNPAAVSAALGAASGKIDELTRSAAESARVIDPLVKAIDRMSHGLESASIAIDAYTGRVEASVARLVRGFDPAAVERFEMAARDADAALGRALVPSLERMTRVVRFLGDAFASLSPESQKFLGQMLESGAVLAVAAAALAAVAGTVSALTAGGLPALLLALGGLNDKTGATAAQLARMRANADDLLSALGRLTDRLGRGMGWATERFLNAVNRIIERVTYLMDVFLAGQSADIFAVHLEQLNKLLNEMVDSGAIDLAVAGLHALAHAVMFAVGVIATALRMLNAALAAAKAVGLPVGVPGQAPRGQARPGADGAAFGLATTQTSFQNSPAAFADKAYLAAYALGQQNPQERAAAAAEKNVAVLNDILALLRRQNLMVPAHNPDRARRAADPQAARHAVVGVAAGEFGI